MAIPILASESTVHVLSPTEAIDAVRATIQVNSLKTVVAALIIPQTQFDAGQSSVPILQYSGGIDVLMHHPNALAGVGTQSIDDNGLLQHNVTVTVGYTPAGSVTGALKVQVDVPNTMLTGAVTSAQEQAGREAALALLDAAVENLKALAAV